MNRYRYLLLALVLCSNLVAAAVEVSIDRNPVRLNESFQLVFESDEAPDDTPDFSSLNQYFDVLNNSQSNNISIINGDYQRSSKWTLLLMPKHEGTFIIPAIDFGQQKTKPFQISILPANQTAATGSEGLKFEMTADRESLYVQGQVVVTLRLMSDKNISGYQMSNLNIDNMDVVIEELGDVKQYQTRINNKAYLVLEKQLALFPQQSGTLSIAPLLAEVQYSRRSTSLFDPFPGRGDIRRTRSSGLELEVLTVDDSVSALNWLPSTSVQISENWQGDLDNLVAGEPITRSISLVAEGVTAAQLPELKAGQVAGVKLYPDQPQLEDQRSSTGIRGSRKQKIALVPTSAGEYEIPEITIPWWNVETGKAEIARLPARIIQVNAAIGMSTPQSDSAAAQPGNPLPATVVKAPDQDLDNSNAGNFWLWLSLLLASGWFVTGVLWYLKARQSHRQQLRSDADTSVPNVRAARKRLQQACADNQARVVRDVLLQWANAMYPECEFRHLNDLAQFFGDPLKADIDQLNQSLYSTDASHWKGDGLSKTCAAIAAQYQSGKKLRRQSELQPLNP